MHVLPTNFFGNPNIGLFGYCTSKYCLIGGSFEEEELKTFKEIFKVPIHNITIAGTDLLGVFLAGNNQSLLVPSIAFEHELNVLNKLEIPYTIIPGPITCLGNTIIANNKGAIISKEFDEKTQQLLCAALKVPLTCGTILGFDTLGSFFTSTETHGIVPPETTETERALLSKTLQLQLDDATVTMGSNYLKSGILANTNGFLISDLSGGPEIINADQALGFIE